MAWRILSPPDHRASTQFRLRGMLTRIEAGDLHQRNVHDVEEDRTGLQRNISISGNAERFAVCWGKMWGNGKEGRSGRDD